MSGRIGNSRLGRLIDIDGGYSSDRSKIIDSMGTAAVNHTILAAVTKLLLNTTLFLNSLQFHTNVD